MTEKIDILETVQKLNVTIQKLTTKRKEASMLKTLQRTALALLGFVGGVLTAPIFALLWPFAAAFILWSEFDGDDDGGWACGEGGEGED